MANVDLYSSSVSSANPATPPAGWSLTAGSSGGVQVGAVLNTFFDTDNAYSGWSSIHIPNRTSNLIRARIYAGDSSNFDGYNFSATLLDSSGEGYMFEVQPYSHKLYRVPSGNLAGSKTQIATAGGASPPIVTDYFDIVYNTSTGAISGERNGTEVISATDTTYISNTLTQGFALQGYTNTSGLSRVTAFDVSVISITSINGGNPITAGQTVIPIEASGFTAKPTSVTATYAAGAKSISATIGSGTATSFNISIQDRVEAEDWPLNGDTLTFTFTYGSESASGTQTLVKKANETVLTFTGAITSDPATLTYWLTQDGFTVEGGENVYKQPPPTASMPSPDLVLTADGGGSVKEASTFPSWFRPATGTGAGNVYEYQWIITDAGISPAISNVFAKKISCRKISATKISSRGI
jgi:hypothetical protein